MMSNTPEADIELAFPASSATMSSSDSPTMRLRLTRKARTLEISRFTPSAVTLDTLTDDLELQLQTGQMTSLGEWTKRRLELPVNGGLNTLIYSSAIRTDERYALLHLVECLAVCSKLEEVNVSRDLNQLPSTTPPQANSALPLWKSYAAADTTKRGDSNAAFSFVLPKEAWNEVLLGANRQLRIGSRYSESKNGSHSILSAPPISVPDKLYTARSQKRNAENPLVSPQRRAKLPLGAASRNLSTASDSMHPPPRKPLQTNFVQEEPPMSALPPLIRRALQNALERDAPSFSATSGSIRTTPAPIANRFDSPSRSSDTRFIPHLGWCVQRVGWSDEMSPSHADVITYQVMFLDGTRLEVDADRRSARLTDRHGKASARSVWCSL